MTLDQIKQAIEAGKTVHWANNGYVVIKDCIGQYLIIWNRGGQGESCIGLTWQDNTTLNGRPDQFYIAK